MLIPLDSPVIFIANNNKNNLNRLEEIVKVRSKYEFGYLIEKIKHKHNIPFISPSYDYESSPERLRLVLEELGPTFIKP